MNISVEFEGSGAVVFTLPQTFFVDITSGVGGTTEPAGSVRVVAGQSLEITVTPAAGKAADKYYKDGNTSGEAVPAGNKITVSNISADHTINVTFKDADNT